MASPDAKFFFLKKSRGARDQSALAKRNGCVNGIHGDRFPFLNGPFAQIPRAPRFAGSKPDAAAASR